MSKDGTDKLIAGLEKWVGTRKELRNPDKKESAKTRDNLLKQLESHIDGMGWETEDVDYYARVLLTIVESHSIVSYEEDVE